MGVFRDLGRIVGRLLVGTEGNDVTPAPRSPAGAAAAGPEVKIHASVGIVRDDNTDAHSEYPFQIVGESHYQDALREIVESSLDPGPNWPFKGAQCEVAARLVPEDDNPYDPLAVRVEIQGHKVGYLSREHARQYRRIFDKNCVPLKALIVGGWDHTYRGATYEHATGSFGVRLAFGMEERS